MIYEINNMGLNVKMLQNLSECLMSNRVKGLLKFDDATKTDHILDQIILDPRKDPIQDRRILEAPINGLKVFLVRIQNDGRLDPPANDLTQGPRETVTNSHRSPFPRTRWNVFVRNKNCPGWQ